jgi:hypothetical protein
MVHAVSPEGPRLGAEANDGDGHSLPSVRHEMAGRFLRAAQHVAIAGANCPSRSIRNDLKQIWDRLVAAGIPLALEPKHEETQPTARKAARAA